MASAREQRVAGLTELLAGDGGAAMVVTAPANVQYLVGVRSSNAAVLVMPGRDPVLVTDSRYAGLTDVAASGAELVIARDARAQAVARAVAEGAPHIAVETHHVTVEDYGRMTEVAGRIPVGASGRLVEALRAVKDPTELALLRTACEISTAALAGLFDGPVLGRTEIALAHDLEARMVALGAQGPAFPTIVASGPHAAVPHHAPTSREVQVGDLLVIDFGARHGGYHADCTRTAVLGPPAAWQVEIHDLVRRAQLAGMGAVLPGAEVVDVDRAARDTIDAGGHAPRFLHGTGHGVGLEIHEAPMLLPGAAGRLEARMTVTVEPGVYLDGRGGVRIEDTVVVGEPAAGGPTILTSAERDLLVLTG